MLGALVGGLIGGKVWELLKDESLLEGNLLELKEAKCLSIS